MKCRLYDWINIHKNMIIHDWINQSLKLCLYIFYESSIIQNRWYNKVYSCAFIFTWGFILSLFFCK